MPPFAAYLKYRQDYPNLNCQTCERLYTQGDLAELPCEICPLRVIDLPEDRCSQLAFRVLEYAQSVLHPEQTPPWDWIFAAVGIRDVETFSEVWHRLGLVRRIAEEHDRLKQQTAHARR